MVDSKTQTASKTDRSDEVDIRFLLGFFLSHWYVFLACLIVALLGASIYLKTTHPVYSTTATILLREGAPSNPLEELGYSMGNMLQKGPTAEDEMEIIRSKGISQMMVDELGLQHSIFQKIGHSYVDVYGKEPLRISFPVDLLPNLKGAFTMDIKKTAHNQWDIAAVVKQNGSKEKFSTKVSSIDKPIQTPWGYFVFTEMSKHVSASNPNYSLRVTAVSPKSTLEHYNSLLQVSLSSKKANTIRITVNGDNSVKNEAIVNKIVELYNRDGLMEKNQTSMQMANFINERLVLLSQELLSVEQDVESFRKQHQLADLPSQSKLFIESAGNYDTRVAEMDIQYSLILYIENYLKKSHGHEMIPGTNALSDPGLTALVAEYNNMALELMRLSRTTNQENPMLLQKQGQLDVMRQNILKSIDNAKATAEITRRDLLAKSNDYESKIENIPTVEREFVEMSRQQAIKQELYLFLLKKREETQLTLASATNSTRVIDAAYTNINPIAPKRSLIFLIAFVAGLGIAALILYLLFIVNDKLRSRAEISRYTTAPILGEINFMKDISGLIMNDTRTIVIAEQFRKIRANLPFFLPKKSDKVILVSSNIPGEGKSFVSINMAASLSLLEKKVVLVGLDLRRPVLKKYLNIQPTYGVTQFLADDSLTVDNLICHVDGFDNLSIITSGIIPPNPSELLSLERFDSMINQLREDFDYVVIDSPPIGVAADVFKLAEKSDLIAYVCRLNLTPKATLKQLDELIKTNRLHNVALVINGINNKIGSGYYSYKYTQKYYYPTKK